MDKVIDRDQSISAGQFPPNGEKWGNSSPTKKTPVPNNAGFVARPKGVKSFGNLPCQKKTHVILVGILGGVGG